MPNFGSHSSVMTPPKSKLISGPMHARHVEGVSIMGGTGGNTSLDSYFTPTSIEPGELPSHTHAASGEIEVPRRSDTFTEALRRPSLSLKRNVSRLRSGSVARAVEVRKRSQSEIRIVRLSTRPEPLVSQSIPRTASHRILRELGPEPTPLNMELDQSMHKTIPLEQTPDREVIPIPPPKDSPRLNPTSSMYSMSTSSVANKNEQLLDKETLPPLPVIPERADSDTANKFNNVPTESRPMDFREIVAIPSYEERMKLYEKTRDYWAGGRSRRVGVMDRGLCS